jgi:FdhD protein
VDTANKINAEKIRSDLSREDFSDMIPFELFLTIRLNGKDISTISCSPVNLTELAVGYLVNNGYVDDYSHIGLVSICAQDLRKDQVCLTADIKSGGRQSRSLESKSPLYLSSACGTIDDFVLGISIPGISSSKSFDSSDILMLNSLSRTGQDLKKKYGGLHSAALFGQKAQLLKTSEDLGRHNCIDKIAGFMLINKIEPDDKIIFTTGRVSMDLIYKVCKMAVPVIASNSSVTYSAAAAAKKMNLTVIGYARGGRFNIYSCPERIIS